MRSFISGFVYSWICCGEYCLSSYSETKPRRPKVRKLQRMREGDLKINECYYFLILQGYRAIGHIVLNGWNTLEIYEGIRCKRADKRENREGCSVSFESKKQAFYYAVRMILICVFFQMRKYICRQEARKRGSESLSSSCFIYYRVKYEVA